MNKKVFYFETLGWLAIGGLVGYFIIQKIDYLEYYSTQRYIIIIIACLFFLLEKSYLALWYDIILFLVAFGVVFWIL